MKVSPARIAAFDALLRIETENVFSSAVLPIVETNLSPSDRALCHEISLGILRRKIYLDRIIDDLSKGRKLDPEVRIALQIGLFQMIFLDRVPQHSAVNESVELVSRARKGSAKAFVNAVLRTFLREPVIPKFVDEIDEITLTTSHPRWLVQHWIKQFGLEMARDICEADNVSPGISFRIIGDETKRRETLIDIGGLADVRPSKVVDGSFLARRMDETLARLAVSDRIYFQDEGSQLVADAVSSEGGSRILDVCAAPGGKTTMIAARRRLVVAGDISHSRIRRLRNACIAHGTQNTLVARYDAEMSLPFDPGSFDTVFVDAPCSGTGTIRHNPEIRYSIVERDIRELSNKQLRILENASELVNQGGTLIYSTCSLETEENEGVCIRFLKENVIFELKAPRMPPRFLTSDGFGRIFPHRDETDGFFVAAFRRL
jgi:16S rRNA (cytosine967-C5)-methyltransferase